MSRSGQAGCTGPGESPGTNCELEVEAAGLCYGHRKQQVRRDRLRPLRRYETAFVRLHAAALALADAESQAGYERAADRLEKAADAFRRRVRRRRGPAQDVVPPRPEASRRAQSPNR